NQGGRVRQGRRRGSAAAVVVAATLTIAVGSAAAATHPHAVQRLAARVLAGVGSGSPGHRIRTSPGSASATSASGRPKHGAPAGAQRRQDLARNAHGKAVSTVAHTDGLTGRAKGEAVSTVASKGKSQAGQHPGHTRTKPTQKPPGGPGASGQSTVHAHGASAKGKAVGKPDKAGK